MGCIWSYLPVNICVPGAVKSDSTLSCGVTEEFGTIQIGVNHLLVDGEVKIDSRTSGRGFINIAFNKGQVVFRADRYVGLIPINENFAIHVRPRTKISNIAHMLI